MPSNQMIAIATGQLAMSNSAANCSALDGCVAETAVLVVAAAAMIDIRSIRFRVSRPYLIEPCGRRIVRSAANDSYTPMASVLDDILASKREEVAQRKATTSVDQLKATIATLGRPRNFFQA